MERKASAAVTHNALRIALVPRNVSAYDSMRIATVM